VGDKKYGAALEIFENGIALHHYHLMFPHPILEKTLNLQANPSWLKTSQFSI
jgi:23S rRNA-/tRNA-specific pseudouridylate synthase